MAFFRAFNCRILYGLYLPTVILTVIWYSITHSLFLSRLKTFLLYKSFPLQPFLSFYLNIYYMDSPDRLLLFMGISVFYFQFFLFLHFLVVGSMRQIKLTHAGFRAHVKIASRIVSYRSWLVSRSLLTAAAAAQASWAMRHFRYTSTIVRIVQQTEA